MTDRQHESGAPKVAAAAPRMLADRPTPTADRETPVPIPAIAFSLLGLASRIESWTAPAPGVR